MSSFANSEGQIALVSSTEAKYSSPCSNTSALVILLKDNNLYKDLFETLNNNKIDLETLSLIKSNEVDDFCAAYKITNYKTKLKFRRLMNIIHNSGDKHTEQSPDSQPPFIDTQLIEFLNQNDICADLYDVLLAQHIGYHQLSTITSNGIDSLFTANNKLTLGTKIRFRDAVKSHQIHMCPSKYENELHDSPLLQNQQLQYNTHELINDKIKIVIIGDSAVGKTSLVTKYVHDAFKLHNVQCTTQPDVFLKSETLSSGHTVTLQIWDTGGQERFHAITTRYYKDADVILLCYECGDIESFNKCQQYWRTQIDDHARENVVVLIIGCKNDKMHGRELYVQLTASIRHGEWSEYDTWCSQCSAKTGRNVTKIFQTGAAMVMSRRERLNVVNQTKHMLDLQKKEISQSNCCK